METQHARSRPPTSNRFSAFPIWNAHIKGLRNRDFRSQNLNSAADVLALGVLYGLPTSTGVIGYLLGAKVAGADGLLAAAGILAGALFMAFTQVATWRDRYTERQRERHDSELVQRYSLDETVAHILMAAYGCLVLTVLVIAGANFTDAEERMTGVMAAVILAVGSYVLLLLLIIMPRLYSAYAVTHQVPSDLSGLSR
jgi:hypothetical protein